MSVSPISGATLPDPASYTTDYTTVPGLTALNAGGYTAKAAAPTTNGQTVYQTQLTSLEQSDTQELIALSFDNSAGAQSLATQLLTQAGQYQQQQQAAAQQAALQAASAPASSATAAADPANLPTTSQLLAQSDSAAHTAINNYTNAPAGSSILDYSA